MAFRKLFTTGTGVFGPNNVSSPQFSSLCKRCVSKTFSSWGNRTTKFLFGQNASDKLRAVMLNIGTKLNVLEMALTQQCNRVAALRLRRAYQILLLYQRIYGERLLMQKVKMNVHRNGRPLLALLSACIFQWEKERVPDEDIQRFREEMEAVHKLVEWSHKKQEKEAEACTEMSEWEQVVDRAHFMVWRRFVPETQLYQYRVYGHFTDIPSRAFYNTQVDLAYWKDWDKNTLDVRVVEKDKESTSEVVHWVYKFPYPMYPRDYVYVRRYTLDQESNTMVITAKATQHPSCPEDSSCVRVATYTSQMVIKPYTTFDENGFEYVMTYCDDPQTNFPTVCYNWMASTGVHEFLEKVHRAARKKHEKSNESSTARMDNSADNLYAKMAHH